ncbi:hypothetical protein BWD42_09215 [Sphingobacterium sp. CZ-UAM]|jgi:hypothetical protein|uniref:hypothetical protein n=1 Tax=Sphingobacterium sp. CZ-UAM TaxID=1933868 RepID=UPI0009853304|nr:hypothetical protein [Sphingobacterium sp. CZ-UAM]OOG20041.1 hypothetical protein BWD42_09215 [Sphingobacterium sp. CZ-UAM]
MKNTTIFLLCLLVFFCLGTKGQEMIFKDSLKRIVKVKIVQKNDLGDKYAKELSFGIRKDTVFTMSIIPKESELEYLRSEFYQGAFRQKSKFFDFNFKADRIVFNKYYPNIRVPSKKEIEYARSKVHMDSISYYRIGSINQYLDSTTFTFMLDSLRPIPLNKFNTVIPTIWGRSAEFIGDLRSVEKEIAKKVKLSKKYRGIDSIIVFHALITRKENPLKDSLIIEKLLFGKPSKFSDFVKEELASSKNGKWRAAVSANNGQRMTTRIKIFAQLKKNGTVELQLPRLLGNWTGD